MDLAIAKRTRSSIVEELFDPPGFVRTAVAMIVTSAELFPASCTTRRNRTRTVHPLTFVEAGRVTVFGACPSVRDGVELFPNHSKLSLFENPTRCADFPMEFMNALYTSLLQDSIDDWAASLQTDLPAMMFVRRVACEVYAIAPPTSIMAAPISTTAVARTNPDFSLVFPMASPSRCRSAALCRTAGPLSARHGLGRLARQAGAAR